MTTQQEYPMKQNTTLPAKRIQKALSRFDSSFKGIREMTIARYGEAYADQVMTQTRVEYEKLLPQVPYFAGRINIFNTVVIFNAQMVSFYKAMKANGKSAEEVVKMYFALNEKMHYAIPKPVRWLAQKFFFSSWFLFICQTSAKHVAGHSEGWQIQYKQGDGKQADWYFECQECGVIKFYQKHGVEELAQYCNFIDYIQSQAFGMGMQNPKNIGPGDEICVQYMKQNRETVLPDNLKPLFSAVIEETI
jgi:hypothetical protein